MVNIVDDMLADKKDDLPPTQRERFESTALNTESVQSVGDLNIDIPEPAAGATPPPVVRQATAAPEPEQVSITEPAASGVVDLNQLEYDSSVDPILQKYISKYDTGPRIAESIDTSITEDHIAWAEESLPESISLFGNEIDIDKETSAFLVGMGESVTSAWHGAQQFLDEDVGYNPIEGLDDLIGTNFGYDPKQVQENAFWVRALAESEEAGTATKVGQIAGYVVEPVGLLMPMGKAKGVGDMTYRFALAGGFLGGVDYVDAEAGESRLVNTAAGVVLGGGMGWGLGKLREKVMPNSFYPVNASDSVGTNPKAADLDENIRVLEELIVREQTGWRPPDSDVLRTVPDGFEGVRALDSLADEPATKTGWLRDMEINTAEPIRSLPLPDGHESLKLPGLDDDAGILPLKGRTAREAIDLVRQKYPDEWEKGLDSMRLTGHEPDIIGAKANQQLADYLEQTGMDTVQGTAALRIEEPTMGRKHNPVEKLLLDIGERIRNHSPRLYRSLSDMERFVHENPHKLMQERLDFADYFKSKTRRTITKKRKGGTLDDNETLQINKLLLNGKHDEAVKYMRDIRGEEGAQAVQSSLAMLKREGDRLHKLGIIPKLQDNYYPRQIIPSKREEFQVALQEVMKKGGETAKAWKARASKMEKYSDALSKKKAAFTEKGRTWTPADEANFFANYVLDDPSFWLRNSHLKARKMEEIPDELVRFYADPIQSVDSWIHRMTKEESYIKLLGLDSYKAGINGDAVGDFDAKTAITHMVEESEFSEIMKSLPSDAATEVAELLRIRLGEGAATPHKALQYYKAITNSVLLGNPLSAVIQLGDYPRAAYKYGIRKGIGGLVKSLKNDGVDMTELGLQRMAQEFEDVGDDIMLAKVQDFMFKWSGFAKVDQKGKNTFLNASLTNAVEAAKDKGGKAFAKFQREMEPMWGQQGFTDLISDLQSVNLKNFQTKNLPDSVKTLLIQQLSEAQPINFSNQLAWQAASNYGKAFMTLKSFTLRQLNTMYRDVYKQFVVSKKAGDAAGIAKAGSNLVSYMALVGGGNWTVQEMRDVMAGKKNFEDLYETPGADRATMLLVGPTIATLDLFSMDEYALEAVQRDGLAAGLVNTFVPPIPIVDPLFSESRKADPQYGKTALHQVPGAGRLFKALEAHREKSRMYAEGGLITEEEDMLQRQIEEQTQQMQAQQQAYDKGARTTTQQDTLASTPMQEPDNDSELIAEFKANLREKEGLELNAYQLEGEDYHTIGYGHYGPQISEDMQITEEKAEELLHSDVLTRLAKIREDIPNFDTLKRPRQVAIFSEYFRGSIPGSPKALKLFNDGKYEEAYREYLNNEEYREAVYSGSGVAERMRLAAAAIKGAQFDVQPDSGYELSYEIDGEKQDTELDIGDFTADDVLNAISEEELMEIYNRLPDVIKEKMGIEPEVFEFAEGGKVPESVPAEQQVAELISEFTKKAKVKAKKLSPLEPGVYEHEDGGFFLVKESGSIEKVEVDG
jgi:GH24 family phage-related lysozyme (muramidase)